MQHDNVARFQTMRATDGPAGDGDDDVIDIRELLGKLWRGKWIIIVSTFFAGLMGVLFASQYEPTYTARTKVMFDINASQVVDVGQSVVRIDETLENQVEILQSTNLIERVIADLGLADHPEFNPALRVETETLVDRIRGYLSVRAMLRSVLEDRGLVAPPPPPPDAVEAESRLRRSVIAQVRGNLRLTPVWDTKVIEIGYRASEPRLASRIANTFAQQYITDQLDAKLEATREATVWLSDRVEQLRLRVESAEEAVEAERAELAEDTGQTVGVTQAQLEAVNSTLTRARAELSASEAVYERLTNAVEEGSDFGAISEFRASALIQSYRTTEDDLMSQETALAERVPDDHPARVRLAQRLAEVRDNIQREARRIVEATRLDVAAQSERIADLERELDVLEERSLIQSQASIRIRQLEREAEASRALYENFLARLKETSEQESLQTANARILSPAEVPLSPDAARSRRTLMLALLLGGMAGVGLIFLLDKLNNTFRAPGQAEDLTGQAFLGSVPSVGRRLRRRDVLAHFQGNPKSGLAEAVRSLRTSILFSRVDEPPKTVMFTSSVPREGKSTTSMLVALTSRQMGKSAIIVDCDLRLPSLARLLPATGHASGLLSLLEGTASLDEAIYRDDESGLDVLMTVPSEPRSNVNAADILSSKKFADIIEDLKARYDLVIFDSPPTLVVADSRILSRLVDAIVYVIRWDSTPRGAVLEGLKELKAVNAPLIGIAFTMLNEARASKYSYEGYSYYRGKYKDYYVS